MSANEEAQKHKINITRRVTGKMEEGNIVFYHQNQPIGKMSLSGDGGLEMNDGYIIENNSIYSYHELPTHPESYAHNCDMGWC